MLGIAWVSQPLPVRITLPKTNSSVLKINGWKMNFLLGPGLCSRVILVSRRVSRKSRHITPGSSNQVVIYLNMEKAAIKLFLRMYIFSFEFEYPSAYPYLVFWLGGLVFCKSCSFYNFIRFFQHRKNSGRNFFSLASKHFCQYFSKTNFLGQIRVKSPNKKMTNPSASIFCELL